MVGEIKNDKLIETRRKYKTDRKNKSPVNMYTLSEKGEGLLLEKISNNCLIIIDHDNVNQSMRSFVGSLASSIVFQKGLTFYVGMRGCSTRSLFPDREPGLL